MVINIKIRKGVSPSKSYLRIKNYFLVDFLRSFFLNSSLLIKVDCENSSKVNLITGLPLVFIFSSISGVDFIILFLFFIKPS